MEMQTGTRPFFCYDAKHANEAPFLRPIPDPKITRAATLGHLIALNQASGDIQLNDPTAVTLIDLGLEEAASSNGLWVAVTAAFAGLVGTAAIWRRRLFG